MASIKDGEFVDEAPIDEAVCPDTKDRDVNDCWVERTLAICDDIVLVLLFWKIALINIIKFNVIDI